MFGFTRAGRWRKTGRAGAAGEARCDSLGRRRELIRDAPGRPQWRGWEADSDQLSVRPSRGPRPDGVGFARRLTSVPDQRPVSATFIVVSLPALVARTTLF